MSEKDVYLNLKKEERRIHPLDSFGVQGRGPVHLNVGYGEVSNNAHQIFKMKVKTI